MGREGGPHKFVKTLITDEKKDEHELTFGAFLHSTVTSPVYSNKKYFRERDSYSCLFH